MKMRFFCEQCGTEVPRNTERCPACGRYFTAIQCPQCGFQGSESDFASGCPSCGYMRAGVTARGTAGAGSPGGVRSSRRPRRNRRPPAGRPPEPPPPGPAAVVYKVVGLLLLLLLVLLVVILLL